MDRAGKVTWVKALAEKLQQAPNAIFVDYQGIDAESLRQLRRRLQSIGGSFEVIKNRLLSRAVAETEVDGIRAFLRGPTALIVGGEEVSALAKLLKDGEKEYPTLRIKGGIEERAVIDAEAVGQRAVMPTRQELHVLVVSALAAPLRGLVYALASPMTKFARVLNAVAAKQKES